MLFRNGKQFELEGSNEYKAFLKNNPDFREKGHIRIKWHPSQVKDDIIEYNRAQGRKVHPNSYPIPTVFKTETETGSAEFIYAETADRNEATGIIKSYSPTMLSFTGAIVLRKHEAELAFFLWMHPLNGKGPNAHLVNRHVFVFEDLTAESKLKNATMRERIYVEQKILMPEGEGGLTDNEILSIAPAYIGNVEGIDIETVRDRLYTAVKRSDRDQSKAFKKFRKIIGGEKAAVESLDLDLIIQKAIEDEVLEKKGRMPSANAPHNQYWAIIGPAGNVIRQIGKHTKKKGDSGKDALVEDLKNDPQLVKLLTSAEAREEIS